MTRKFVILSVLIALMVERNFWRFMVCRPPFLPSLKQMKADKFDRRGYERGIGDLFLDLRNGT
jgi:hypothetical protein